MSLFKAREWWGMIVESANTGEEEECDVGSLLVANVNNEQPARVKVVVGGFSGALRVFLPQVCFFKNIMIRAKITEHIF